jgi:tight adherence protein B
MMLVLLIFFAAVATFGLLMALYMNHVNQQTRAERLRQRLGIRDDSSLLVDHDQRRGQRLAILLDESGLGWDNRSFYLWVFTAGTAGLIIGSLLGGGPTGFLCGLGGAAFFPVKAIFARSKRMTQCDQQMPQALQLMVLALRAGHALPGALALAAREIGNPLRDELRRAVDEQGLGRPISEVISRMARRLPASESAQTFAVAILVLEQTGGNLISVIDRIISGARARTQYKARLRALTSEGRYSAMILACLPLAFFTIAGILDPNYWKTMFGTHAGHWVLGIVLSMWAAGGLWTYKLVSKEPA